MPCHYPQGDQADWCERHVRDHAMLQSLRGERAEKPLVMPLRA